MLKQLLVYGLLLVAFGLKAQNLVPNPSFEDCDTACNIHMLGKPIGGIYKSFIKNWFYAKATPDIFRTNNIDTTNSGGCWGIGGYRSPNNVFGYQYSRTGNAYLGLCLYSIEDQCNWAGHTYHYREWVGVKLSDTLKANQCYRFEMYVSRAEKSNKIVSAIGAYLSPDSLFEVGTPTYSSPWPIDSNDIQVLHNPWETIYDTTNWVLVSGTFKANGNEVFMYLGNFLKDNQYPIVEIDTLTNNPICNHTYFFIDDVSLYEVESPCTVGIPEQKKTAIKIYPNPATNSVSINMPTNYPNPQLYIYNLTGQLVATKPVQPNQPVPITELSPGMYIFAIQSNNTLIGREKVVVY